MMSLSVTKQEEYRKQCPHIAPEIVNGSGRQSFSSDIFSLGQIVLAVLDLLPTATGRSIKVARTAICDDPNKRPLLNQLFGVDIEAIYITELLMTYSIFCSKRQTKSVASMLLNCVRSCYRNQ